MSDYLIRAFSLLMAGTVLISVVLVGAFGFGRTAPPSDVDDPLLTAESDNPATPSLASSDEHVLNIEDLSHPATVSCRRASTEVPDTPVPFIVEVHNRGNQAVSYAVAVRLLVAGGDAVTGRASVTALEPGERYSAPIQVATSTVDGSNGPASVATADRCRVTVVESDRRTLLANS